MESGLTLNGDMMLVLAVLVITIMLFVFEVVRVDIVAISIMVLLGLLGLVPAAELFNGFASNAVISIIAVMILGAGLDRTGVMSVVAKFILNVGGKTARKIIPMISGMVGGISGLMQNCRGDSLVSPRGIEDLEPNRDPPVPPADADGFLRHHGRHPDHGRLVTADPVERSDPGVQCVASARSRNPADTAPV